MLKVLTLDDSEQWDAVVRSFDNYDVYYLSGYMRAFQLHGDGKPLLFYYRDGSCQGINIAMKRDIERDTHFQKRLPVNTYFDLSTPYGYGGWLFGENGSSVELFCAYEEWCRRNHIVSEFVRFHPLLENYIYSERFYDVVQFGETIFMDLFSKETIWNNLTSKNRNMIRKARKNGIRIYYGNSPEFYENFRDLYNATMDKDHAKGYYYFNSSFYQSIREDLSYNAQIFYAELDGKVIASSIMLAADGKLNYHLSGSLKEYQHLAPTNLLIYEAAMWGCENGYKTLHLGGGLGAKKDSLYQFKKSFNRGEPCRFYVGKKVFNQTLYRDLLRMRKDRGFDQGSSFFPLYRAQ